MSLHRSETFPDWEKVLPQERNVWQKVAAKTGGIVTPGNFISVAGGVFVAAGLRDIKKNRKVAGTIKIGVGRIFDLVDGTVADMTKTKSPTGEIVDTGIDKAATFAGLFALPAKDILPADQAITIGVQNLANTVFSGVAKSRGVEIHPTRTGKDAMMAQWVSTGLHCISAAAQEAGAEKTANVANFGANGCFEAYACLGMHATRQYASQALS
jgi:phosphatidylglycerophosphate synthase